MPFYLLLPLACALVYTVGSLLFKRAYLEGAGPIESFHWANILAMPFFLPLFFVNPGNLPPADWWRPILTSALIYAGAWCTFAAIAKGDVSLVTPVLGTKVVFVAFTAVALAGTSLSPTLWLAAFLTTAGIVLVGIGDAKPGRARADALILGLLSSLFFGVSDVLIGMWAPKFGGTTFLAALPAALAGGLQNIASADDADNAVRVTFPHRQAAMWDVWIHAKHITDRKVDINRRDHGPRREDLRNRDVIEADGVGD
jgi:drug/metabolite transporter (DMT)-like permease